MILASRSPRRREILAALGVEFEALDPAVEELGEGDPREVVVENARRKARVGLQGSEPGSVVIGADTEVCLDGRLLGKADNEASARAHLEALSGRTHTVLGGLVVLGPEGGERSGVAETEVTFHRLAEHTLTLYLESGEWRDRAGAYAIQGLGSILIEAIRGDFANVVGLPVTLLLQLAPELISLGNA